MKVKKKLFYRLQSQNIDPYTTQIQLQAKRKVGHFDITLILKNQDGKLSQRPLIQGIYSKGNISQSIKGWLDIHYSDRAEFENQKPIILSQSGHRAEDVFKMMGEIIEPGGMIFVSMITDIVWEIKSELHRMTRDCLSVRSLEIPPAATPLGRLLFISGCQNVKSQAFDVQGSSRIAGEKGLNAEVEKEFLRKIQVQLKEFLNRKDQKKWTEYHRVCRLNAEDVLDRLS
ncbi:MAG: DUF1122 family protein [Acidobacteriota bacterium]